MPQGSLVTSIAKPNKYATIEPTAVEHAVTALLRQCCRSGRAPLALGKGRPKLLLSVPEKNPAPCAVANASRSLIRRLLWIWPLHYHSQRGYGA